MQVLRTITYLALVISIRQALNHRGVTMLQAEHSGNTFVNDAWQMTT
jgi:hypothetical protein